MPSPSTIASPSTSNPNTNTAAHRPALSSTPPEHTSALVATSFTSPSPRSAVQPSRPPDLAAAAASSRGYHHAATAAAADLSNHNRSPPGNSIDHPDTKSSIYKASAVGSASSAAHLSSTGAFPATSSHLPRKSSLLPPYLIVPGSDADTVSAHAPPTFQDPFNAQPLYPLADPEVPPPRRPSRSSSAGGLSDGFRNLNRWSASTTSSRASNDAGHKRNKSSLGHRASLGLLGLIHGSVSPKRLQKQQPPSSLSNGSPRSQVATRALQDSISVVPPLESLPHIATLPSLELDLPSSDRNPDQTVSATSVPRQAPASQMTDQMSAYYWDGPTAASHDISAWQAQVGSSAGTLLPEHGLGPSTMSYHNGEPRVHSRSRSTGARGGTETMPASNGRDRERSKHPSQKAMLSKALQKANTAVQLDNAQNPYAARDAYAEACELLQQVLQKTGGEEDRKKLEAIRETYTKRIDELDLLLPPEDMPEEKALPRRPISIDRPESVLATASDSEEAIVETATVTRIVRDDSDMRWAPAMPTYSASSAAARKQYTTKPTPQLSIQTSRDDPSAAAGQYSLQSSFSRSPRRVDASFSTNTSTNNNLGPPVPMYDTQYLPPPLSPRRPLSPIAPPEREPDPPPRADFSAFTNSNRLAPAAGVRGHRRDNSHESVSWLDPIEESGGSSASSVHSRSSSVGIRRKHIRAPSGETEAEFDAALDDAIEAAYNDGYEPDDVVDTRDSGMGVYQEESADDAMASVLKRVELAREAVRASEREAMIWASEREKRLRMELEEEEEEDDMMRQQEQREEQEEREEQERQRQRQQQQDAESRRPQDFYDGNDSDDEERFLDEMRKEYAMEDFTFTASQKRPLVPRESDSSGLTNRTWQHSSMGSNPPTASTTMLTTVSEGTATPALPKPTTQPPPPPPPPTQSLPQLPPKPMSAGSQSSTNSNIQGVRSRRLSGQNAKQLKIETAPMGPPPAPAPATVGSTQTQPKSGGYIAQQRQALSAGGTKTAGSFPPRHAPSPLPGAGPGEDAGEAIDTPPLPSALAQEVEARSGSPSVSRPGLKKNFSSSSLRSMKSRNMSVSNVDDVGEMSPSTPMGTLYGFSGSTTRLPAIPSIPTSIAAAYKDRMNNPSTGGLYLLDNDIHSPRGPTSPNPLVSDAPVPLEPCPTASMLRPFWLMRCLYQTLCHPRGGYVSNKLFVPRDVWRVKGVKLKGIEDKIANCDYLTAALQKLARVDNCDADALLEEMQTLEGILEQVQAALARKLGSEVGVHGANHLFSQSGAADGEPSSMVPRSASVSAKSSSAFSWRRLRGKNSSAGLSSAYAGKGGSGGGLSSNTPVLVEGAVSIKDTVVPSLPMTSNPTSRPAKRDASSVQFGGPYASYMSSLAKLFDAAQTVDQIARQVEDPGLRHADKTQVGLELCTRHAAEFFGFYICRFVLADLTLLLDKFIKRGSEWVLA